MLLRPLLRILLYRFLRPGRDSPELYGRPEPPAGTERGRHPQAVSAPNFVADRFGPVTIYIPMSALAGICMLSWQGVRSTAELYVWVVFYGAFAGGIQSLFPAGISSLTTDMRRVGVRLGMVFTIVSFAALTGPPIAGAILSATQGRYFGAQILRASRC